jgi:hypothetical protein
LLHEPQEAPQGRAPLLLLHALVAPERFIFLLLKLLLLLFMLDPETDCFSTKVKSKS